LVLEHSESTKHSLERYETVIGWGWPARNAWLLITKKTLNGVFFCFRAGGGNDGFAIFRYADGLPPYGFIAVR